MPTYQELVAKIKQNVLDKKQRKEQSAWEWIMSTKDGRRVMFQLMKEFGLYDECFDKNGQEMARKASRQACAQFIKNRISFWVGGNAWMEMESEEMQRVMDDQAEIDRETKQLVDNNPKKG
ncbi:MAG: hypothetical protein ACRDFB_03275 [Rhabdochlamydiaceae bacterium]